MAHGVAVGRINMAKVTEILQRATVCATFSYKSLIYNRKYNEFAQIRQIIHVYFVQIRQIIPIKLLKYDK